MMRLRGIKRVLFLVILLCPFVQLRALPFNDEMVDSAITDGQIMRPLPAGSVARGTSHLMLPPKSELTNVQNPVTADERSLSAGRRLYQVNCAPCHGTLEIRSMAEWKAGVSGTPLGSPNLLHPLYHQNSRSDGYIFATIHYGGMVIMPRLSWKLSFREHWDIVNYLRQRQRDVPAE